MCNSWNALVTLFSVQPETSANPAPTAVDSSPVNYGRIMDTHLVTATLSNVSAGGQVELQVNLYGSLDGTNYYLMNTSGLLAPVSYTAGTGVWQLNVPAQFVYASITGEAVTGTNPTYDATVVVIAKEV